jgi:sugar lactone lactonase YvrE
MGQFKKPRSLATDTSDNLYVVDMTGRVQKFSPDGKLLTSWRLPETDLGKPKGMCRDKEGNIVVLEPHYQRVNHFTPDGTRIARWGVSGTQVGKLSLPRAVISNSRGDLIVTEYGVVERVQSFSFGSHTLRFSVGKRGAGEGEFNRAEGIGIGLDDRIYIADSCNHRIQVLSHDGQWQKTYGSPGQGPGELSYPYDIKIDGEGRQFVCEFGNSRLQVFDADQQPLEIIGGPGSGPGKFSNPWAIALDSQGNLYVADSGNHRVQKLVRNRPSLSSNPKPVRSRVHSGQTMTRQVLPPGSLSMLDSGPRVP